MSSIGCDDSQSQPTPRQEAFQGPCLWWLQNQQSCCEENSEAHAVRWEYRPDTDVPFLDRHTREGACIEIKRLKAGTGVVRVAVGDVETECQGPAVLEWQWKGGQPSAARKAPRVVFPSDGVTVPLPHQRPHLSLVLPDLCALFNAAGIVHNLHPWGVFDEAVPPQPQESECHCSCSIM
eukprot:Rhum_TRINITY_DN4222_c1_g1::Rhum_TRINITY_DN4222_c1_g1_i1::g.13516::m.13516